MNKRLITLSAIIGLAALSRLLPHPPNVTPIAAMALFAGANLGNRKAAFLLPIAAMFLSDIAAATFSNAVIFYLVTNFSVWAGDPLYPKTWTGLIACYTAAIPFFRNSLIGDFSFVAALFGGFAALENFFISLREQQDPLSA